MKIQRFTLGEYQSNCYIISFDKEAIIIDPGYENEVVIPYLLKENLTPKIIFLTHGHFDHIGGVNQLKNHFKKLEVIIHKYDLIWLDDNDYNLTKREVIVDRVITNERNLSFNDHSFEIILTPGHSAGGMALKIGKHLFSGDTLFKMSIGRYDLPFANQVDLFQSIKKLYLLDDETIVYPGHGDKTTIGFEKRHNPFIKG